MDMNVIILINLNNVLIQVIWKEISHLVTLSHAIHKDQSI